MDGLLSSMQWVVAKALALVADGVLDAWATSKNFGPHIEAMRMELFHLQATLETATRRQIGGPAMEELLRKLRDSANSAEDLLDELDYFRIHEQLHGTYEVADDHTSKNFGPHIEAMGMELLHVQATLETATRRQIGGPAMEKLLRDSADSAEDLLDELDYFRIHEQLHGRYEVADDHTKHDVLNARHTFTKAIGKLACLPACCSAANPAGEPGQIEDARKHVNGCMPKLGKLLPCSFSPHGHDDNSGQSTLCAAPQREHAMLGLNTVDVSERMKHIVEQLQPVCREVTTILQSCDRITFPDISQSRLTSTAQIIESELYARDDIVNSIIHDMTNGQYCDKPLTVLPVVGLGGVGKTTLMQHIYCNQQVLTHFRVVWICVSVDFNLNKLLEEITESIPKVEGEKVGTTAEQIEQSLKYKRFLLVLDDIWQISYGDNWEMLKRSIRRNIKDIIDFKLSVDQQKIIRKEGIDMDIFWCIVDTLAEECNHGKFSDVRHEDQFFALIGDTVSAANGQSISSKYCGRAGGVVNLSQTAPQTGGLAAMKSLGTECVNFSVTDSSLQNRAHCISSADASGRLRPEVDTGFCSPLWVLDSGGAPPPWIYDTGASFSLTEDLCLPLPPHHHRPRAPPVWIYDTGASFSLTGDLSLLPGVCSTGDCSPFLGLHRADPVSAANGQSVVSNKCGRASGTVTGLISSSEPIAADNSSLLTPDTTPEQTWRVASAAPQHMTGYLNHLIDYTPASGDQVIDTPNMGPLAVHGRGSVNTANITLQDVLYVPCLDANLVSTGQLTQLGYMITLGPYGCRIYKDDEDMPLVGKAHYIDGYLLELDFLRVRPSTN